MDVTQLEPPAPLQMALEAIESLPSGDYLRLLTQRDPVFLYPLLLIQDFDHETKSLTQSGYEVLIWRKGDKVAEQAARAL